MAPILVAWTWGECRRDGDLHPTFVSEHVALIPGPEAEQSRGCVASVPVPRFDVVLELEDT